MQELASISPSSFLSLPRVQMVLVAPRATLDCLGLLAARGLSVHLGVQERT